MTAQVRIRLCPVLAVETADGTLSGRDLGSRKARTLLALLAAERGGLVPVDRVADVLWPSGPPADPAANVATLVSRTRRLLGVSVLTGNGRAYGIDPTACTVDVDEAQTLLDEAASRFSAREPALAVAATRRALGLLGSPPELSDESDADWVLGVRREAGELRRRARQLLSEALLTIDPSAAADVAAASVSADPFDEQAVRALMRARVAAGSAAAALLAYDELARRLRDELGTDPAPATSDLHLAILREAELPAEESRDQPRSHSASLLGREVELATVDQLWADVGAGVGHLVLVEGEGGIGKTRLLGAITELASATGGLVVGARCHPAERSLFLQPYVDALRPVLLGLGVAELGELLRGHASSWAALLPELAGLVEVVAEPRATPDIERRRAYDAVAAVLGRLARRQPVVLTVDDLQDGGAATADLLAYLAGRLAGARVLLVGAVRAEAEATVARLVDRAVRLRLQALPAEAVRALATEAGLEVHADEVLARTAGHSLSVVEYLRALAAGDAGVPESLAAAVRARVDRLHPPAQELVQGASVLRGRVDPRLLAALLDLSEVTAARLCEELAVVGLLHRVDTSYEFVNDLAQECVYLSLAPAVVSAYHRRAADLLSDQPESMAAHAFAAGEHRRAAQGWLLAGQAAMDRSAVEDAIGLFDRSLSVEVDASLRARALLARARAHEASTSYAAALSDIDESLALARTSGDRRIEMAALRARGGDAPVGLRLPMEEVHARLESGLHLAANLGDRRAEADFTTRLTVLDASRLRLARALSRAEQGLVRARASSSREAVPLALDGVKTALSYLGETARLRAVVSELIPPLREQRSNYLLQWAVFESSFVAAGEGHWDEARSLVEEALEINGRSGFTAYAGYFRAHLGWYERLTGDLDSALALGRAAVAETSPVDHPWWFATTAGLLAGTLIETGDRTEAAALALHGLTVSGSKAPEAWRLRCLAPLAAATDGPAGDEAYAESVRLLDGVECPPGKAWVIGADCYLLVARAAQPRGEAPTATRVLGRLRDAVDQAWDPIRHRVDDELAQSSSATS